MSLETHPIIIHGMPKFCIRVTFTRSATTDTRVLRFSSPADVKRDGYTFPLTPDPKRDWIFPTRAAAEQKKRVLVRHFGEDFFTVEAIES